MSHKYRRDENRPSPSSPYFEFGIQRRRFPFLWNGGQGGIVQSGQANTHSPASSLGMADMLEAGYGDPNWIPFPVFSRTGLHHSSAMGPVEMGEYVSMGDWPLLRPAGPEPQMPGDGGDPLGLSDNEKTLATVAVVGAAAWFLFFRKKRARRNPSRRGYYVISRSHGVQGAIVLSTKREAKAYASYLRKIGKPARIKKR